MINFSKKIDELVDQIRERVSKEPMTPLERSKKVYTWDETLGHAFGGFAFWDPKCVGVTDVTAKEFYTNPEKMVYCLLVAAVKFKHDSLPIIADTYQIDVEACGTKLHYPEDSMPVIVEHAIQKKSDLAKLRIPNPKQDGRMPYFIEVTKLFVEKIGDIFYPAASTEAPFSGAVGLRGYENLVRDMREDPLFVHELLEYALTVQIEFTRAIYDAIGYPAGSADAWAAPPNISPKQLEEFALPYAARLLEAIKVYSGGKRGRWGLGWGYSLAPDQEHFLRMCNATGSGTCSLFEEEILGVAGYGKVNLARTKEICRQQKVVLSTNLLPQLIYSGPPETITERVTKLHDICGPGGGHMYYTTVPLNTPFEHVEAYVRALKNCRYPVQANAAA